jgi:hypothetical protein
MSEAERDRAANEVVECRVTFDLALSDKRKYSVQEFRAFVRAARRYMRLLATGH